MLVLSVLEHQAWPDELSMAQVLPVLEKEYDFWMNSSLHHYLPELGLNVALARMWVRAFLGRAKVRPADLQAPDRVKE